MQPVLNLFLVHMDPEEGLRLGLGLNHHILSVCSSPLHQRLSQMCDNQCHFNLTFISNTCNKQQNLALDTLKICVSNAAVCIFAVRITCGQLEFPSIFVLITRKYERITSAKKKAV